MDDEELYDSLEEEFSSASSSSLVLCKPSQNSEIENNEKLNEVDDDSLQTDWMPPLVLPETSEEGSPISSTSCLMQEFEEECNIQYSTSVNQISDISLIVPLYDGDRNKCDIRRSSHSLSSPVLNDDRLSAISNADDGDRRNYQKKRSIITNYQQTENNSIKGIVPRASSKSYLAMFRARMGCPEGSNKKKPEDTVRSIYGDSERSNISEVSINEKEEFIDFDDSRSDTTSFYLRHIEDCNKIKSGGDRNIPNEIPSNSTLSSISQLQFNSVSQVSSNNKLSDERKPLSTRRKAKHFPIPVLGGLGPDMTANQEKLELRKKQLKYGQKASYRNRIKMMEVNVLKSLKEEIRESNSLDDSQKLDKIK